MQRAQGTGREVKRLEGLTGGGGTLELWKEPKQLSAPERFRSGNGGGGSLLCEPRETKAFGEPQLSPSIVALLTFSEPLILRYCKLHKTVYKSSV